MSAFRGLPGYSFAAAGAAALVVVFGSLATPTHAQADASRASGQLYVTLTMKASKLSSSGIAFYGTTNLPSGTLLMFDVASKAYTQLDPNANASGYYYKDQKIFVHSGHFRTRTFTFNGGRFPRGSSYRAEVITPFTGIEPISVQEVFGLHGKNLTGPLVKKDLGDKLVEPPPIWVTIP